MDVRLTRKEIQIGHDTILLDIPADPEQALHDAIASETTATQPSDPYWSTLWSAATPMANLILQQSWPENTRAIELGCGAGLVGIAALKSRLTTALTDYVSDAVELARSNAQLNDFPEADAFVLDWHRVPDLEPSEKYSIILASDVLYEINNHKPLLTTIDRLLARDGMVWLGDPGRELSRRFISDAAAVGWKIRLLNENAAPIMTPQRAAFQLIELRRS